METFIPTWGLFRYLNPGPFNRKENAMIVIMASAAANSALGTEVLAVQRLFYNIDPNPAASIFMLFSSQMIGYGIGGLMRCRCSPFVSGGALLTCCSTISGSALPVKDAIPWCLATYLNVRCLFQCRKQRKEKIATFPHRFLCVRTTNVALSLIQIIL